MHVLGSLDDPLIAAFPGELADDVRAVAAVVPASRIGPLAAFRVVVDGRPVTIPERIYHDEPSAGAVGKLSSRQRRMLHCLYARHYDGHVRQRHVEELLGSAEPWAVPFVVQAAGEYVVEILAVVRDGLRAYAAPGMPGYRAYGRFIAANPAFFDRTQRRVVSYWSCYHRAAYPNYRDYPGCALLGLLRSAAADHAGRRIRDLTPSR